MENNLQKNLTPELMIRAYSVGKFLMAKDRCDPNYFWVSPENRGILPLKKYHISRNLKKKFAKNHIKSPIIKHLKRFFTFAGKKHLKENKLGLMMR